MSDDASPLWSRPEAPELTSPPAHEPVAERPVGDPDRVPPDLRQWWAGFVAVVVGYITATIGGLFVAVITGETDGPAFTIAATYVQDAVLFGFAFLFARLGSEAAPLVALGFKRPAAPGRAVGITALALLAFLVFNVVYGSIVDVDDATGPVADRLGIRDGTAELVLSAILLTLIAPIVEEALFRGLLFGALWRWKGWFFGAVVSGIVFGGIHAGGAPAVALPVLAGLGFALAFLYWSTGSLLPAIGVHALNNAFSLSTIVDWSPAASAALVVGSTGLAIGIAWAISVPARSVLRAP